MHFLMFDFILFWRNNDANNYFFPQDPDSYKIDDNSYPIDDNRWRLMDWW